MRDETLSVQKQRKLILEDVSQLMQSVDKHIDVGRARAEDWWCYKLMRFKTVNKYMKLEAIQFNDSVEELKKKDWKMLSYKKDHFNQLIQFLYL